VQSIRPAQSIWALDTVFYPRIGAVLEVVPFWRKSASKKERAD
jgi:hypothetical protein